MSSGGINWALLCITLAVHTVGLGHEEPSKTLKEKTDAERARATMVRAGVRALTLWKHDVNKGICQETKSKFVRQEYDRFGRLTLISAFRDDTVSESAVYSFNPRGDMLSDIELSQRGTVVEASVFVYDEEGRVISGYSHNAAGRMMSRFAHVFDTARRRIEFIKYDASDRIEYMIEYEYSRDFDSCDYNIAVKRAPDQTPILKVSKEFDALGRVQEKTVTQFDKNTTSIFRYKYDEAGIIREICKLTQGGTPETITQFAIDKNGLRSEQRSYDEHGKLLSFVSYTYEYVGVQQ